MPSWAQGVFNDKKTGRRIHIDNNARSNHYTYTLVGRIYYADREAHCKGASGHKGAQRLERMLVTENLEIIANKVTIRESFQTVDIEILELGKTIRAPVWEQGGLKTKFGVIASKAHKTPCQWKEVQEIEASGPRPQRGSGPP